MKTLKTLVDESTQEKFIEAAKQQGLKPAELLRLLIIKSTGEKQENNDPIELDTSNAELAKMTIRLPQFLEEAAKQRGKTKGMAASRWIAALVQSNLMTSPVLTEKEIIAVQESNRQLAAIGRNLNQIARALNTDTNKPTDGDSLMQTLAEIKDKIANNETANNNLIKASRGIWINNNASN